jgi:hypothetical protein
VQILKASVTITSISENVKSSWFYFKLALVTWTDAEYPIDLFLLTFPIAKDQ